MAGEGIAKSIMTMKVAMTVNSKSTQDARFYFDSAADDYMTYDRLLFSKSSEVQLSQISMADNSKLRVLSKGTVSPKVMIDGETFQVNVLNILHSPDLEYNLLLVGTIEEAGYSALAKNEKITVFDNEDNLALVGTQIATGYLVDVPCDETYKTLSFHSPSQNHTSWIEWHRHLSHLNMLDVKKLAGMSLGINAQKATLSKMSDLRHDYCETCVLEKHHRISSRVINHMDLYQRATKEEGLSHVDLAEGGKTICTLEGSSIVFSLTDDWIDLIEIHLLRKKSEAFSWLKKYGAKRKAEGSPMNRFEGDNGDEFDSAACKK